MQKIIFVVDDNDTNLSLAKDSLKEMYRVMTLPSAGKMFALLANIKPDLILLDIKMPEMNGFDALHLLKSNPETSDIPVIFLTGVTDVPAEVRGFQLGVVDFITKPFSGPVLRNRIKTHLDIDMLIRERTSQLHKRTNELQHMQNSIVHVVADIVEKRDRNTGGHIERTTAYISILLDVMRKRGAYDGEIRDLNLDLFISSARLHDVGKIAISDSILNKPGKLTNEEFKIMKTHAEEGVRIIDQIISRTVSGEHTQFTGIDNIYAGLAGFPPVTDDPEGGNETFLSYAKLFAGYHHERWDGKGYPYGLAGADIPIQGRIMAFADVYDAIISERPYKKPFSHDEAVRLITEGGGTQFDPYIMEIFNEAKDQFKNVRNIRII